MASLHVITGPMFSGKSEELDRLVRRAIAGGLPVLSFCPAADTRYAVRKTTHAGRVLNATVVSSSADISEHVVQASAQARIVAVDEAQFFDKKIVARLLSLVELNIEVIVAALNRDSTGKPWDVTRELLALADKVTILTAVCAHCGVDATCSHRKTRELLQVVPGGAESYESLCRWCFSKVVSNPWKPE